MQIVALVFIFYAGVAKGADSIFSSSSSFSLSFFAAAANGIFREEKKENKIPSADSVKSKLIQHKKSYIKTKIAYKITVSAVKIYCRAL